METLLVVYTHAYMYLIREREFVLRGEDVYKLGLTKQQMSLKIKRFDAYKKGSELILLCECPLAMIETVESNLKKDFRQIFVKHSDGDEYFIGNRREMAARIFQACSNAWTPEEERLQHAILNRVYTMTEPSTTRDATIETLQEKIDKEAAEIEKIKEEEQSIHDWFTGRCDLSNAAYTKRSDWYVDYRDWCSQNSMIPMTEAKAVLTFKRLYQSRGISVGNKSYGFTLKSQHTIADDKDKHEEPPIPLIEQWIKGITDNKPIITKLGASLLADYKKWCENFGYTNELSNINQTSFGLKLKKSDKVKSRRARTGTLYTIGCE